MMLFRRTYERGYRDGARLAVEVVEKVIEGLVEEREDELCACSPGGTDAEDELPEFHSKPLTSMLQGHFHPTPWPVPDWEERMEVGE